MPEQGTEEQTVNVHTVMEMLHMENNGNVIYINVMTDTLRRVLQAKHVTLSMLGNYLVHNVQTNSPGQ